MEDLLPAILEAEPRAIARAATAIENHRPGANELLKTLFPHTGRATVIGITGPPGAGKSTLVDQLIKTLRAEGGKVAVIAVDPSSPFSGGAILGDRIRMQQHHADPGVFIRSMATRGHLGGLARATFEIALLLDAAGYPTILIETVGVGQDEVEIARLAGVSAVVLVPGMGDDIQALKAGILEIADLFVINKADQPGAEKLEHELRAMIDTPILQTVATKGEGIDKVIAAARQIHQTKSRDGVQLWAARLKEMLRDRILEQLPAEEIESAARQIASRTADPYTIVQNWISRIV